MQDRPDIDDELYVELPLPWFILWSAACVAAGAFLW